jgi:KDO2-lipid IV(A) lauroyltransferase
VSKPTPRDRIEYAGVMAFVWVARFLPLGVVVRLARLLGSVVFDILGYRRGVALKNLERHLGQPAQGGASAGGHRRWRAIGRESCGGFIAGLAEFARLPMIDRDYVEKHVQVEGREHLDEALRSGRGALLVTGHFGSWEVTGCALALLGYPVKFVVGVQRNPLVQGLMNRIRMTCGVDVIEPRALARAVRSLRSNQLVAMLADQDAGRKGVFVDFMGEQASTPRGPARLAQLAGSPIIPGFAVPAGIGRHRMVIEQPIYPSADTGPEGVAQLTQTYTGVIETYVKRYPASWLWTHRRWKTRSD